MTHTDAETRTLARTAAALVRLHLSASSIGAVAERLETVAAASDVRTAAAGLLVRRGYDVLRLEVAAAAGIAEACRTSIALRLIEHEEYARHKQADLSAAADAIGELLGIRASPDTGVRS